MQLCKVVFLDFDGVLNSVDWHEHRRPPPVPGQGFTELSLDPAAVAVLNALLTRSGAGVVVSSTWRRMCCMSELRGILQQVGFTGKLIGETVHSLGPGHCRGDEIQAWLNDHPWISHFVILDDADDMGALRPQLVHTDEALGLQNSHIAPALRLLGVAED